MAEEQGSDQPLAHSPTQPSLSDLTGTTLGKYRLVEKLGQGGMAQVYKAYQPDLDRYVAVKVLHPHLTSDAEFAARFRREARAIAALEHPHSVRIYDFDTDGVAFLVMEYLEGVTLKARLRDLNCRNELMDLGEVVRIISALADALDYSHRHGVVHRDVKPANVLLTQDGRPVLTDFGIARMIDATLITGTNGTLGTPAYMSPEQGKGEPGDARSDIYALGAMLYQLCTGHLPFDADTPYAIILKHLSEPLPPPRSLRPNLPEALERVILKALAKDPDDRYKTAGEMGNALRAAVEARAPSRPRLPGFSLPRSFSRFPSIFRRRPVWQSAVLVAITLLICFVLFALSGPWRIERYMARLAPTPTVESVRATLMLQGQGVVEDTWLNPDEPDQIWQAADRVHLQAPPKSDRIVMGFNLSRLPPDATVISATLTLRVEPWSSPSFPGSIAAYRITTPWKPTTATYNTPWFKPGLLAGQDYDPALVDLVPVQDTGWVVFDMTEAVTVWQARGRVTGGLVLMMTEDSHSQSHYWVYTTDYPDAAYRPTLRISYRVVQ